jgi:hypothetical protein
VTVSNVGNIASTITSITDVLDVDGVPGVAPDSFACDTALPAVLTPLAEISCDYTLAVGDAEVTGPNTATATTQSAIVADDTVNADWTTADVTQINETMKVSDIGTAYGTDSISDTVTAPTGGQWTLTDNIAYADFATCGDHTVRNTASLLTEGDLLYDEASDEVAVDVQCLIFQGETAWAANGDQALQKRYQNRGNWATYVEYAGVAKTTTVFAGQTFDVGSAAFSDPDINGDVTITITLDDPWEYGSAGTNLHVEDYDSKPGGNPSPGLFTYHATCDPAGAVCEITVPEADYYGVHLEVGQWIPEPGFPD